MADAELRVYAPEELRGDGYPHEWPEINAKVVAAAGHRCVRCGHPYRKGENKGSGGWSPCDDRCTHQGEVRWAEVKGGPWHEVKAFPHPVGREIAAGGVVEASWRILTVHHMRPGHENKADCRWWNLLALCQRCHLTIQTRVDPHHPYPWEHSEWFKPYAAGFYAWKYAGAEIDRNDEEAIEHFLKVGKFEDGVERMPL